MIKYSYSEIDKPFLCMDNLDDKCKKCMNECEGVKKIIRKKCPIFEKQVIMKCINDNVRLIFICTDNYLNTRKQANLLFNLMQEMMNKIYKEYKDNAEQQNKSVKRILHNMTKYNSHCLQAFYLLVPQEKLSKQKNDKVSVVKNEIEKDTLKAANQMFSILKNNTMMKNSFTIMKLISGKQTAGNVESHKLSKITGLVLNIFQNDIDKKKVKIIFNGLKKKIYVCYETYTAGMSLIIDNIIKYAYPGTDILFTTKSHDDYIDMIIETTSLKIFSEEYEKIFDEEYSGIMAKKSKLNGSGLGMFYAKNLLEINKIQINFEEKDGKEIEDKELIYTRKKIILSFPVNLTKL